MASATMGSKTAEQNFYLFFLKNNVCSKHVGIFFLSFIPGMINTAMICSISFILY